MSLQECGHGVGWGPCDICASDARVEKFYADKPRPERVERALAWDRARVAVREAHAAFKKARQEAVQRIAVGTPSGLQHGAGVLMMEGLDLVEALDELERLEGGL